MRLSACLNPTWAKLIKAGPCLAPRPPRTSPTAMSWPSHAPAAAGRACFQRLLLLLLLLLRLLRFRNVPAESSRPAKQRGLDVRPAPALDLGVRQEETSCGVAVPPEHIVLQRTRH